MPTTSAVAGHGVDTPPPLAPHIHVHLVKAKASDGQPEKIVLLAPLVRRATHWIPGRNGNPGRTAPCGGTSDCEWCRPSQNIDKRINFYAPALLLAEVRGEVLWRRVVLCVANGSMERFTNNERGAVLLAERKGNRVHLNFGTYCHQLDEPAFDIEPVLALVTKRDDTDAEDIKDRLLELRHSLTPEPIPPVIVKPADPAAELAAVQARLEQLERENAESRERMARTIEEMKAAGRWPVPPKVDPKVQQQVEDAIKFKGKSIAERKADGTYNPSSNGTAEGGAE